MAGVFEDPALRRTELVFAAPRPFPYGGILGLELIQNAVRTDAGKALGNLQFLPSTAKRGRLREVGGFNHQCRTFVPADGIAHPGTSTIGAMLGADVDDAYVVDHFNDNGNRILALCNLVVIVVEQRQHDRSGAVAERG